MKNKNHLGHFVSSAIYIILILILSLYIYYEQKEINISVFAFFILALAIFRLTWLFVYDSVMDFVRDYFKKSSGNFGRTISEILNCPLCTGVWISLFIVAIYIINPITWIFILIIALAGLALLIHVLTRYVWRKV